MEQAVHVIGRCSTYFDVNPVWHAWDAKTRIHGEGPSFPAAVDDLMKKLADPKYPGATQPTGRKD